MKKREWLRELRIKSKLTMKEISSRANITQTYYFYLENGDRRPSPSVAQKLSLILKFDWTKFYDKSELDNT